jgi:hypothetical protein
VSEHDRVTAGVPGERPCGRRHGSFSSAAAGQDKLMVDGGADAASLLH